MGFTFAVDFCSVKAKEFLKNYYLLPIMVNRNCASLSKVIVAASHKFCCPHI